MNIPSLLSDNFSNEGKAMRIAKEFIAENPTVTEASLSAMLSTVISETDKKSRMKEFERLRKNVLTIF